ncbi:MAG TPA: P27 family phage terminase small subunit [Geminicoccus sp.]|uniref:P27 family phage terminase small subunit n=1 Tax=Geminicoccus sp. TaxID=2024832 RepID=UPI002E31296D|nr:P27 family phage terminase small subunit [Geminicoccus sp.]HEX2526877.1 P27 family phage terminase small subunit [Geminicoccus sp.]
MKKPEGPPKQLTTEAKRWWLQLSSEYQIDDEAGLLVLQTSLEAFDRMRDAQKQIKKDGMTSKDRFGQTKSHPLLAVERDARAQLLAGLKALNLDIEPLNDRPGRPPGSKM